MLKTLHESTAALDLPDDLASRLRLACRAVERAGEITRRYFQSHDFDIESKPDGSVVTTADRATERALRELITDGFPKDGLVGEEYGEEQGGGDYRWVLDPIDGTKSFACGVPLYGTLIALQQQGRVVVGLMSLPALGEVLWSVCGQGAWHVEGETPARQVRVSGVAALKAATVCTTSFDYYREVGLETGHDRLCRGVGSTRGWSDCYAQLLLATGRIDAVVEPLVYPWDVAAVQLIIEEAGGRYSDWAGEPTIESRTSLSSNGLLHTDLLALLAGE